MFVDFNTSYIDSVVHKNYTKNLKNVPKSTKLRTIQISNKLKK